MTSQRSVPSLMKLLSLLVAALLVLAACGGPATTSAPPAATEAEAPAPTEAEPTEAEAEPEATEAEATAPPAAEPTTLVVARRGTFEGINPITMSSQESQQNATPVYEALVQIGTDGNIIPALAESWETEDFQEWTFHLREGVVFHDGTPFNAEAVKFNYDRLHRAPGQSGGSWTAFSDENSIEVVDDYTVAFHLLEPFPGLLLDMYYPRYYIASPTYIQENATTADPEAMEFMVTHASGTGPFRLVELVPDQRVVFEKFEDYWGGVDGGKSAAGVDQLIFQAITDADAARVELEAGRVDIYESPPPAQLEALSQAEGVEVVSFTLPRIIYLTMDVSQPPFDNVLVRQAVAHAINYDELREAGELGHAGPQCGMIPGGITAYLPADPSLCLYPYDPEKAMSLLAEAGYASGFTVDLLYSPGRNAGFDIEAQLLQSYLAAVGITANVQSMEVTAQIAQQAEGAYGLGLMSWSGGIPDADDFPGWLYDQGRLPCTESWVCSFWDNQDVMEDMRAARASADPDEKQALYTAADQLATEEAIYIPLFQGSRIFAIRDNVEGLLWAYSDMHVYYVTKN